MDVLHCAKNSADEIGCVTVLKQTISNPLLAKRKLLGSRFVVIALGADAIEELATCAEIEA
jgi:hypothetical protein